VRALFYGFIDVGKVGAKSGDGINYTSSVWTVLSRSAFVVVGGDKDKFFNSFGVQIFDCLTVIGTDIVLRPCFSVKSINSLCNSGLRSSHC
jgi:hypothetical protein